MLCIKMYNSYLHPLVPRLLPAGMEGPAPCLAPSGRRGLARHIQRVAAEPRGRGAATIYNYEC